MKNGRWIAGIALVIFGGAVGFAQAPASPPTSLHVVLLQATNAPGPAPSGLPPSVLAALKGATASRPYKSLKLLDQAVARAPGAGASRLKGPGNSEYVLAASSGAVAASTTGEFGIAVHLYQTKEGVLEPTTPEVLWAEFTAKPGEGVFVWPWDEKTAGGEPLVLLVTPLTRELAVTFLQAPAARAADALTSILDGQCGTVIDAPAASAVPPVAQEPLAGSEWKTEKVRVVAGVLQFERVKAVSAAGATAAAPRAYRVALRDLGAPEFRVSFAPKPEDPFVVFPFRCGLVACVTVDGVPESALRIRACTEKASELLKAIQTLIIQAGGEWGQ